MAIDHEQWGEDRDTNTYCQAFDIAAVTTCFNDLSLSRLGFEHQTFRLQGERSNPQLHRRGTTFCINIHPVNSKFTTLHVQHLVHVLIYTVSENSKFTTLQLVVFTPIQ